MQYTAKILAPGDELSDAFSVRHAVFVREQGFCADTEFDSIDPTARHVVLYSESGTPIATGRVFAGEKPGLYVIGRVAALPECRGGIGPLLMTHLEDLAAGMGAAAVTLGAQCRRQGFYQRLGYTPYGEEYLDEHCPHIHMKKAL